MIDQTELENQQFSVDNLDNDVYESDRDKEETAFIDNFK